MFRKSYTFFLLVVALFSSLAAVLQAQDKGYAAAIKESLEEGKEKLKEGCSEIKTRVANVLPDESYEKLKTQIQNSLPASGYEEVRARVRTALQGVGYDELKAKLKSLLPVEAYNELKDQIEAAWPVKQAERLKKGMQSVMTQERYGHLKKQIQKSLPAVGYDDLKARISEACQGEGYDGLKAEIKAVLPFETYYKLRQEIEQVWPVDEKSFYPEHYYRLRLQAEEALAAGFFASTRRLRKALAALADAEPYISVALQVNPNEAWARDLRALKSAMQYKFAAEYRPLSYALNGGAWIGCHKRYVFVVLAVAVAAVCGGGCCYRWNLSLS
jgi:hypothetical protein